MKRLRVVKVVHLILNRNQETLLICYFSKIHSYFLITILKVGVTVPVVTLLGSQSRSSSSSLKLFKTDKKLKIKTTKINPKNTIPLPVLHHSQSKLLPEESQMQKSAPNTFSVHRSLSEASPYRTEYVKGRMTLSTAYDAA